MVSKWMGDRYVLGFVFALRFFLWSQILCRLYKSPSDETKPRSPVSIYASRKKITYIIYARKRSCSPYSMSEFVGLWKQQNNPACTKSVSLHHVEVGHYTKEAEH